MMSESSVGRRRPSSSSVGDANGPVLVSETGPGWGIPHVVVREGGVEPPHPFEYTDLNRARLPIPPLAHHPAEAR
jgi:hypothetical protein